MKKMHPVWWVVIGVFILVVPTLIYLCFLVPTLSEEYNVLMASGGVIGGAGYFGASLITDKVKYGSLYKTAANAFSTLAVVTLVQDFIAELVGLVATFVVCYVIFKLCIEAWKSGTRKREAEYLATQIAAKSN